MINLKARETKTLVAVHGWAGAVLPFLLGRPGSPDLIDDLLLLGEVYPAVVR